MASLGVHKVGVRLSVSVGDMSPPGVARFCFVVSCAMCRLGAVLEGRVGVPDPWGSGWCTGFFGCHSLPCMHVGKSDPVVVADQGPPTTPLSSLYRMHHIPQ